VCACIPISENNKNMYVLYVIHHKDNELLAVSWELQFLQVQPYLHKWTSVSIDNQHIPNI
jgi:galactose-1-phosphate uridylyltransferase